MVQEECGAGDGGSGSVMRGNGQESLTSFTRCITAVNASSFSDLV